MCRIRTWYCGGGDFEAGDVLADVVGVNAIGFAVGLGSTAPPKNTSAFGLGFGAPTCNIGVGWLGFSTAPPRNTSAVWVGFRAPTRKIGVYGLGLLRTVVVSDVVFDA